MAANAPEQPQGNAVWCTGCVDNKFHCPEFRADHRGSRTWTCRSCAAKTFQLKRREGAKVCECGNKLMIDAIFCRKCGKKRDEATLEELPNTPGGKGSADAVLWCKGGGVMGGGGSCADPMPMGMGLFGKAAGGPPPDYSTLMGGMPGCGGGFIAAAPQAAAAGGDAMMRMMAVTMPGAGGSMGPMGMGRGSGSSGMSGGLDNMSMGTGGSMGMGGGGMGEGNMGGGCMGCGGMGCMGCGGMGGGGKGGGSRESMGALPNSMGASSVNMGGMGSMGPGMAPMNSPALMSSPGGPVVSPPHRGSLATSGGMGAAPPKAHDNIPAAFRKKTTEAPPQSAAPADMPKRGGKGKPVPGKRGCDVLNPGSPEVSLPDVPEHPPPFVLPRLADEACFILVFVLLVLLGSCWGQGFVHLVIDLPPWAIQYVQEPYTEEVQDLGSSVFWILCIVVAALVARCRGN